jgi:ribose transport system substrate-binding protein
MKRIAVPVALLALLAAALTACGSSGSDNTSSGSSSTSTGSSSGTADTAKAQQEINPYLSAPTKFPISDSLSGSVAGKKLAFLDCGTPTCALGWTNVSAAATKLGMDASRVNAGLQADTVSSAFDTITSQGVDAAIDPALPNPLAQSGLQQLKAKNIPAVGIGVVDGDPALLPAIAGSNKALARLGALTATYMVSKYGDDINTVYYTVPELQLTTVMYDAFQKQLLSLCPSCKVRTASIPVADLGTTAPTVITDDLQAHPDTKQAAFTVGEEAIGLPAAMKAAGISIPTIASGPGPDSFQQIKDGDMTAGIGYDLTYVDWDAVDAAARLILGDDLPRADQEDYVPMEVITQDNVTDDMIKSGWTAFPDIASQFASLWGIS